MAKGNVSNAAANIAIFMDDLPVKKSLFVGPTPGHARYQLGAMRERLGKTRNLRWLPSLVAL